MKRPATAIAFVIALFTANTVCAQYKNDLERYHLSDHVKTIGVNEWAVRDSAGTIIKKRKLLLSIPFLNQVATFNPQGFIAGWVLQADSNQYVKRTYDEKNRLTTIITHKNNLTRTQQYVYETVDDIETKYQLDSNGKTRLEESSVWKYGKPMLVKTFTHADTMIETHYTYNHPQAALLYAFTKFPDKSKETYLYELKNGIKQKCTYTFYHTDGKKEVKTFFYDAAGNIIEETHKDTKGMTTYTHRFAYTFDAQGNWVTRKMYFINKEKKELVFLAERTITYYE